TFPAVVLVVSLVAYFTAYYLKGDELRINKVDVVDIVTELDPEKAEASGAQANGTTFFTLFSPRIQNYTISVTPAPGWGPAPAANANTRNPHGTVVSWMAAPENIFGGSGRGGSLSLYRRAYRYAPGAAG